jgi:hypothetical protein
MNPNKWMLVNFDCSAMWLVKNMFALLLLNGIVVASHDLVDPGRVLTLTPEHC